MKDQILSQLPSRFPWRERIHVYDSLDSTNNLAKSMAAGGAPLGTVIIARQQTAGRGRMSRSFASDVGGLYCSLILRPECPPQELMHLTCAAAAACCDAIQAAAAFRPGIKWTNDLVYRGRKLAGILTELSLEPASGLVNYAVVGIGINCLQKSEDFPAEIRHIAGSLSMAAGHDISPALMAAHLINALHTMADRLTEKDMLMKRYRKDCITLGKEISLVRGDEIRHGMALDVDEDGALVVRFSDGTVGSITSGEVSVRGMYGYV